MKKKLRKNKCITTLTLMGMMLLMSNHCLRKATNEATEIIRKADQKVRGKTAYAEMTIHIIRATWERELGMKSWSKGDDYALILVTSPAKEKGTVSLKRVKEVWSWLPSIERSIKLPPSMMMQSWMGTDFTNDDLVKQSSIVEDYTHTLIGDSTIAGRLCYKINMIPKPEAAVVWGKIVLFIDKKEYIELRAAYYDEEGVLVNIMTGSDIKVLGGKLLASKIEMIPVSKPGQKTVLIYNNLKFDTPIDDDFFSIQHMKTVK